jgi:hypothetical protein
MLIQEAKVVTDNYTTLAMIASQIFKALITLFLCVGAASKSVFPLEEDGTILISCSDAVPNAVCTRNGGVGQLTVFPNDDLLVKEGTGVICLTCTNNGNADVVECEGTCTCKKCLTDETDCNEDCSGSIASKLETLALYTGFLSMWFLL